MTELKIGGSNMTVELDEDTNTLRAAANTGNKQWVAVITDTHPKYNYDREFVAYQKPKTSDRDSGTATVEDGAVIERVRFTHSGKNRKDRFYQLVDGQAHPIDEIDVEAALEGEIVADVTPDAPADWDSDDVTPCVTEAADEPATDGGQAVATDGGQEIGPGMVVINGDRVFRVVDERPGDDARELKVENVHWFKTFPDSEQDLRSGWLPEYKVGGSAYPEEDVEIPDLDEGDRIRWQQHETVTIEEIDDDGVYHFGSDMAAVPDRMPDAELAVEFAAGGVSTVHSAGDVPDFVTDEQIESAIEHNDDPDHPDAWTVDEVREALARIHANDRHVIGEMLDVHQLAGATDDVLLFVDGGGHELNEAVAEAEIADEQSRQIFRSILSEIYHDVADDLAPDRDWSVRDPIPMVWDGGLADLADRYALRVLVARGCSPAEALDYWTVEVCGRPMTKWADERGTSHQAISKNVRAARGELE